MQKNIINLNNLILSNHKESSKDFKNESLYRFFIEPFVDVLKAADISLKMIINPLASIVAVMLPFGNKWIKERMRGYKIRRDAYANQWNQLQKKFDDSLSIDAKLFFFFSQPAAFLGFVVPAATIQYVGKDLLLDATGLGPFIADGLGAPWEQLESWSEKTNNRFSRTMDGPDRLEKVTRNIRNIENLIQKLFFKINESKENKIDLSLIVEKKESKIDSETIFKRLSLELSVLDQNNQIQKNFDDLFSNLEDLIKDMSRQIGEKNNLIELLKNIKNSKDFDEFLKKCVEFKLISNSDYTNLKNNFEIQSKKLFESEKFKNENAKDATKQNADSVIIGSVLSQFVPKIDEYSKLLNSTVEELLKDIPPKEVLEKIPKNSNVEKLIKAIDLLENLKLK
jgi:hypothetical protein